MPCTGIKVKSGDSITIIPCQFSSDFQEDELMEVDGKKWCPFHAPLEGQNGNLTKKANWKDDELKRFYVRISTLRENAIVRQETLNLRGVVFPGDANFQNVEFPEVDFSYAQFNGDAVFLNTPFNGSTKFLYTQFIGGHAVFLNARFNGTITNFSNAQFNGWTANFSETKFKGIAIFLNAQFNSTRILFKKSRFKEYVDFTSPGNKSDASAFQGVVSFENAEFLNNAIFDNRNFQQRTTFKNCTFHKAPRFHDCRLHQDTDFTDAKFLDTKDDEAARAYRTLKLDMEEKRARQEQLLFYALEMKSRRQTEKRKILKFLSWLYEATSDYGQRIFLPLAWLVYLFLFFTFFYAAFFKGLTDSDAASILPQSLNFSIKQIIRPFGVFGSLSNSGIWGKIPPSSLLSLPLIIAATLQSFLSLALLLLSALAARWSFKIG